MKIPFSPPYIDDDVIKEVKDALQSGWITTGPKVRMLEEEIAAYAQVEKALAVNSATSAMILALHWFGVKKGDEVIIPAYTYAATALAVMHVGAHPVMVDAAYDFNIDPGKIRSAISEKTKAIISVDYGGRPCDYQAILSVVNEADVAARFSPTCEVQRKHGRMLLLSDAAHALGAIYKNKPISCYADITVFSLHAVKNITSAEGGIICLNMPAPFNNSEVYDTLRLWSLNGQTKDAFTKLNAGEWQYDIVYPGFKMNLPDVLAAIALAQLRKYDSLLLARKEVCDRYDAIFGQYDWACTPPFLEAGCASSAHLYPLRIRNIDEEQRNEVIKLIALKGVSVNVHFIPLPMLTVFREAGYKITDYPVSYRLYRNEISLPVYPQLDDEACKFIADAVVSSVEEILVHG